MDTFWQDAKNFLAHRTSNSISIIGPLSFATENVNIISEALTEADMGACTAFVIHKGDLEKHDLDCLQKMTEQYSPIYANEVFVIYGLVQDQSQVLESEHVDAFSNQLKHVVSRGFRKIEDTKLRPIAYLGNNKALTTTRFGHKIVVDTRDMSLAPHILMDGEWEAWIVQVFLTFIKPGMNVVDVGSNVGFYSLLAAEKIGPDGSLTCFEANSELASTLFHNLQINGFTDRSKVLNKAVFSHKTKLDFKIYENYMGSSSIWASEEIASTFHDKLRTVEVDAISLDEYFSENAKVDLLKIDAEGAEPFILKGSERLISANPNIIIIMEFVPALIERSYGSVEQFYNDIHDYGLTVYEIKTDSSLSPLSLRRLKEISGTDVVLKR